MIEYAPYWLVFPAWDKHDVLLFWSVDRHDAFLAQVSAHGFNFIDEWVAWQLTLPEDDPARMEQGEDYDYYTSHN